MDVEDLLAELAEDELRGNIGKVDDFNYDSFKPKSIFTESMMEIRDSKDKDRNGGEKDIVKVMSLDEELEEENGGNEVTEGINSSDEELVWNRNENKEINDTENSDEEFVM